MFSKAKKRPKLDNDENPLNISRIQLIWFEYAGPITEWGMLRRLKRFIRHSNAHEIQAHSIYR